ncbi:MFS transporter [Labrys monachus]|uniref:MFS family permease n=1 Tax=Labrys monachus TaxID=217067 RepID=A0ABU0F9G8_9HYPH|nr:MFS transporter [Labrys monachus]MDQ0391256.1 MFS family permease [Labrys monachus]
MITRAAPASGLRRTLALSRQILPLMVGICVAGAGNGLLTTVLSLHLGSGLFGDVAVRLVLTAFPIGFVGGCLAARSFVARLGHQRTFLAFAALTAAATAGFALDSQPVLWFVLRFVNGLSMAVLFIVAESWINLYAGASNRGTLFSLYMLMTSLSVLLGQLMVRLADPGGSTLFLLAACVGLAGVLYASFGGRWPALPASSPEAALPLGGREAAEPFGLWRLACLAPVTVIAAVQAGMTNLNVFVMTPLYGAQIGLDTSTTVGLTTAFSIGGLLAQTPVGWLSDTVDRRMLLVVGGGLAALLCGLIALLGNNSAWVLFALFFFYGAVTLTIYPVAIAFANARLETRFMVSVSGRLLLLYSIGGVFSPVISTQVMARFQPEALFVFLGTGAFLVMIAASYNLLRAPLRRSVQTSPAERSPAPGLPE